MSGRPCAYSDAESPRVRINHVLEEIAVLRALLKDNDFDRFSSDPIQKRAAAYALQNISEAVRNIPDDDLAGIAGIEWARVKGFGNVARHEYFRVDARIVWETLITDLDDLWSAMKALEECAGKRE